MKDELLALFRRNFPFAVKDDCSAGDILNHEGNVIFAERNAPGELIGASVINGSTILMLCVDKEYRNKGIGTKLLQLSEEAVKKAGHSEITAGVGFDYLMPGVPTSKRYYPAVNERLNSDVDQSASDFFTERGYFHSAECNIFDMRFPLEEFSREEHSVGDTIDGIIYRWAEKSDLERVCECTDDGFREFTQWYKSEALYGSDSSEKVLIADDSGKIAGALIVSAESESLGTIGCTVVRPAYRGRNIATLLVTLGTKYLRDSGLKEAFLSYTYSGLDKLYGCAGYKICNYYMMAKKKLSGNK